MRWLVLLVVCFAAFTPSVRAQEDGNIQTGVFVDYFRSGATGTNMFGLGGRFGVDIWPHTSLEGDMAYDFNRGFTDAFSFNGGGPSFITSGVRTLHGFVGPRYTIAHGPIHPFVQLKVGFVDYIFDNIPSGSTSVSNPIQNLRDTSVSPAVLFGGGLEGKIRSIGLRLDVADEMYFNHGPQQGLRVTFGPFLRF
jgi:hypothetical protein